ncbi:hypothetical protein BWK59_14765 [Flavobacterium davisii]|uniref:Uncharacterized protein n=1 Tax=Flavobacterium davisii TaxID=2906077 RepID=A0A246GGL6_9FLAO|nr:hypothetical protein [Flavobacterium davisii]OWP82642.1 hypothetical protein BWK59_14765 [Flavobacterium davisii]
MIDAFERLEHARKYLGLSYKTLSDLFNLTSDGVNKAIKNKRLSQIQMNTFADKYNINKEWLFEGNGDFMRRSNSSIVLIEDENLQIRELNELLALKEKQIVVLKNNLLLLEKQIQTDNNNTSRERIEFLEKQNEFLTKVILERLNDLPIREIKETHELMTRNLLV